MKRALFRGFGASALELAPTLLGAMLVREIDGVRVAGRIVETEAYPGGDDRGSHSRGGRRTPRNASMFLAGGATYVYLIYGMHHCVNVVSGRAGDGEAVLIRALEPIEGIETMRRLRGDVRDRDLCRGPGRLAAALAIDRTHDGRRLERRAGLWIETGASPATVACTARIGLGDVGPWADRPWRWFDASSPHVSRMPRPRR
ncbi:MAG: DNA-3-methyladenine glycosylase [Phycisphaerales bacterium]|jgi:DNA-3-methyladenine glycosylase